ncbi:MAG: transglutaminase domain-containing protein [Aristaeellaceae bacterium]
MKELHFAYRMTLRYDPPVRSQRFTLRCIPPSTPVQQVQTLDVQVTPRVFLSESRDGFGNLCLYGLSEGIIGSFTVRVTGDVRTGLAPGEAAPPPHLLGPLRYPSPLTRPGEALARLAERIGGDSDDSEAYALRCMEAMADAFAYTPGVTGMATTAEEAAALSQGVCQDMAHVLLALLRMQRIPCRYVCGMMLGEGASHAWVEVCDGERWIGLDPTNHHPADEGYIRISVGRDAGDCLINRGIVTGAARQVSQISVSVREKNGAARTER